MEENSFYTKGDKDSVVARISQVHTITMFCPMDDVGVQYLRSVFKNTLPNYESLKSRDFIWEKVPAIDALKVFLTVHEITTDLNIDTNVLTIITASLKAFTRLKYITFEFTYDENVMDSYKKIINNEKNEFRNNVYKINILEFNLSDMFSQNTIDFFNKILVNDEIISNNYLSRDFRIDFSFDEYISFMDMFLGNNGPYLNQFDNNICDYFRTFPQRIAEQKPIIRIITNYSDL